MRSLSGLRNHLVTVLKVLLQTIIAYMCIYIYIYIAKPLS